jgi:hypothetical protein
MPAPGSLAGPQGILHQPQHGLRPGLHQDPVAPAAQGRVGPSSLPLTVNVAEPGPNRTGARRVGVARYGLQDPFPAGDGDGVTADVDLGVLDGDGAWRSTYSRSRRWPSQGRGTPTKWPLPVRSWLARPDRPALPGRRAAPPCCQPLRWSVKRTVCTRIRPSRNTKVSIPSSTNAAAACAAHSRNSTSPS